MSAWATSIVSPIFANNSLKVTFKLFLLTDVDNYCEERKIKLFINNNIKKYQETYVATFEI